VLNNTRQIKSVKVTVQIKCIIITMAGQCLIDRSPWMPGRREELCGMFWNMFTCWNSTLCQHPQLGPDKITWPERIDVSSLLVSLNLYCVVSSDFVKLFFVWRMHYRDVLMSLSYQWPEREVGSHITEQKELFIRYNFVLTLCNKLQMVNISLSLYLGIKKNKKIKKNN